MSRTWQKKVALVTGAGRGLGRAVALGLAEQGAQVALLARSQDQLDEVAQAVRDGGGTAMTVRADMGDDGQVARAAQEVRDAWDGIDILVNNAGLVRPLGPTPGVDLAEWSAAFAVNVFGVVALTCAVLPTMLERGWGRIVNVSSGIVAAPQAMIGGNAYVSSKAALEAHTVNLAAELAGSGVTVNVYRPGMVDTAMQGWIRSQDPDQIGRGLHDRFTSSYEQGALISPATSAAPLLANLPAVGTGQIWSVT